MYIHSVMEFSFHFVLVTKVVLYRIVVGLPLGNEFLFVVRTTQIGGKLVPMKLKG